MHTKAHRMLHTSCLQDDTFLVKHFITFFAISYRNVIMRHLLFSKIAHLKKALMFADVTNEDVGS
jgi:hypothetical protein